MLLVFSTVSGQDTINIDDSFTDIYFGTKSLFAHTDYSKNKLAVDTSLTWRQNEEENIRLKTDKQNWLKCTIKNNTNYNLQYLCFLHNVQIDFAQLFLFSKGKLIYKSPPTGCTIEGQQRATLDRTLSLPIMIPANSTSQMFIGVYRKEFGITISPHLVNPSIGNHFEWTDYFFLIVIFINVLIIIIGISIYIYCRSRKYQIKEISWFIIYVIISTIYVIAASGYGSLYIWGKYPWFEINAAIFFGALSGASFLYFCKLALKIPQKNKMVYYGFDVIAFLYFTSTIPGFLLYFDYLQKGLYGSIISIFYILMLLAMIYVIGLTFYKVLIKKEKEYYWFIGIFIFYIAYTALVIALEFGIVRYNFRMHAWRIILFYLPQLIVTLAFLINKILNEVQIKTTEITNTRKELSQDIHDEIGSGLTRISLLAHLISKSDKIDEKSQKQINKIENDAIVINIQLRELIFAINPSNDKFSILESYLREMINAIFEDNEIIISYPINEHKFDAKIDPLFRNKIIFYTRAIAIFLRNKQTINNIIFLIELKNKNEFYLSINYVDSANYSSIDDEIFYLNCRNDLIKIGLNFTTQVNENQMTHVSVSGPIKMSLS